MLMNIYYQEMKIVIMIYKIVLIIKIKKRSMKGELKDKRIKLSRSIIKFQNNCKMKFKPFKRKIMLQEIRIKEIQIQKKLKVKKMIEQIKEVQIHKKTKDKKKSIIWKN